MTVPVKSIKGQRPPASVKRDGRGSMSGEKTYHHGGERYGQGRLALEHVYPTNGVYQRPWRDDKEMKLHLIFELFQCNFLQSPLFPSTDILFKFGHIALMMGRLRARHIIRSGQDWPSPS